MSIILFIFVKNSKIKEVQVKTLMYYRIVRPVFSHLCYAYDMTLKVVQNFYRLPQEAENCYKFI